MVEDKDATTPEDAMNQLVQKEEVQELLESLNDRERQVIRLRFVLCNATQLLHCVVYRQGRSLKIVKSRSAW